MSRYDTPETRRLFIEYRQTPSVAIRNRIAEAFVPLVYDVAGVLSRKLPRCVDSDELVAFGMPGLLRAIDRYDPANGNEFATFASFRIRGAMLDELRLFDTHNRLAYERSKRVNAAQETFYVEHGRMPDEDELQATLGVDDRTFALLRGDSRIRVFSLSDKAHSEDERTHRGETKADLVPARREPDPDGPIDSEQIIRRIVLPTYGLRAALILRLRYLDSMTMVEVGKALEVSESRISQLHRELIDSLRYTLIGRAA